MGKYILNNEDIKKYLGIEEEFRTVQEFHDYLLANDQDSDITVGTKTMIVKMLSTNPKEKANAQKRRFGAQAEWILANCILGKEIESGKKQEAQEVISEVIPENDFQKVKAAYEDGEHNKVRKLEDEDLDYTEGIVLREGGIITQQDRFQLYLSESMNIDIDLSKILIVESEGNKVLAMGHLVPDREDNKTFTIVFDDRNCIDYEAFQGISQGRFILYAKQGQLYSRTFDMDYQPYNIEYERPLCIDFGTSNTAVGSYGIKDREKDGEEIARFIDVTVTPANTEAALLPTIVYVDDCSDPDNIKYLFGYEARKKIEDEHYESKASVYYEIKRWISSADEEEEVRDNKNHKAAPLRRDIIKAYLDYVIECSEQYFGTRFRKIHFSAPVKLKGQFIEVLTKMYEGEKQVLPVSESIDEGIAIVYTQIKRLMNDWLHSKNKDKGEKKQKSIMIMDCGGGTTDLASCEFEYWTTDVGVHLELNTCFENGNSNFGGNNITYRIMQLLKIKIADKLSTGKVDGGDAIGLIDKSENEILRLVEEKMKKERYDSDEENPDIYAKFLDNYARAEEVIPTQYEGNTKYPGTESLRKIKRNFYYLWRLAEQIKIEFYKTERVVMEFDDTKDAQIDIRSNDNYYLYIAKENRLQKVEDPFDKVSITIKEINRVICADIYSLLVGLFHNGELTSREIKNGELEARKINVDEFDYYKLSGQSCNISLFSELIKEYIPGRKFRPAIQQPEGSARKSSEDLKLDCVLGCINYVRDQIRPGMEVESTTNPPEFIYNVVLRGTYNEDKVLFDCGSANKIGMEASSGDTLEYPLAVVGKDGVYEREFVFKLMKEGKEADEVRTTEWIENKILDKDRCADVVTKDDVKKFIKELADTVDGHTGKTNIVFVVPAKPGYGVYIGQIQADNTEDSTEYKLLRYRYHNFEDSSKTFFDGHR